MDDPDPLLDAARRGDTGAADALLASHRPYLRTVVGIRFDLRLRARVDESDVVQDALLAAARRLPDYLARRPMGFRPWLRATALECLVQARRTHLGADCRDAARDLSLDDPSVLALAGPVAADDTPGRSASRRERAELVRRALAELADDDREVIALRVFEGLANSEAAEVLGVAPDAASKRLARALVRLRTRLDALGLSESQP